MAGRRNKNLSRYIEEIGTSAIKTAKYVLSDEVNSKELSGYIMRDLVSNKNRRFNDYSGNLSRSYFVAIRGAGQDHLYAASKDPNVIAHPEGEGSYEPEPISKEFGGGMTNGYRGTYFLKRRGHKIKGKVPKYRLEYNEHVVQKGNKKIKRYYVRKPVSKSQFYRYVSKHRSVEYAWSLTPKRYIDRLNRGFSGIQKSSSKLDVVIGNYTPYRRFVEAKGYRVLGGGYKTRWAKKAKEIYGYRIEIGFKQLAYRFNNGTKVVRTPLGKEEIRTGQYMRAKENAGIGGSYGHYKLVGLDFSSSGKKKGIYEWVFDKLY